MRLQRALRQNGLQVHGVTTSVAYNDITEHLKISYNCNQQIQQSHN